MKKSKYPILILTLVLTSFVLEGCFGNGYILNCEKGNGDITRSERITDSFTGILLKGSGKVYFTESEEVKVAVETDENIIQYITTDVESGDLVLSSKKSICTSKLKFHISAPNISSLKISGSGDIETLTPLTNNNILLEVKGSGDIKAKVKSNNLVCKINGSGDIDLKGECNNTVYDINGSGDINALKLINENCQANISGSGNCKVNVSKRLESMINGSGDIRYLKEPKEMKSFINGSGDIQKI